jgi:vanillate O-demethylase ferredoxin subunit
MSTATLPVRIVRKTVEADEITSLLLAPEGPQPLPEYSAGSHIDVLLPSGLVRQYSLCNAPGDDAGAYRIAVLHEPDSRGGSRHLHTAAVVGDRLLISAPKNHFALAEGAAHSLLFAGGIGITPILAMAEALAQQGASYELHYASRSPRRAAFQARLAADRFAGRVRFYHSDSTTPSRLDTPSVLRSAPKGSHLYVCGPRRFIDGVLGAARVLGWPDDRLHWEVFAGEVVKHDTDGAFAVRIRSSGLMVQVAKDKTVVEALADAGVQVETSCEQGVCGTCVTRVLEGTPDHRDQYFTPAEHARNDQFTPCCSRSCTPMLVLDL